MSKTAAPVKHRCRAKTPEACPFNEGVSNTIEHFKTKMTEAVQAEDFGAYEEAFTVFSEMEAKLTVPERRKFKVWSGKKKADIDSHKVEFDDAPQRFLHGAGRLNNYNADQYNADVASVVDDTKLSDAQKTAKVTELRSNYRKFAEKLYRQELKEVSNPTGFLNRVTNKVDKMFGDAPTHPVFASEKERHSYVSTVMGNAAVDGKNLSRFFDSLDAAPVDARIVT